MDSNGSNPHKTSSYLHGEIFREFYEIASYLPFLCLAFYLFSFLVVFLPCFRSTSIPCLPSPIFYTFLILPLLIPIFSQFVHINNKFTRKLATFCSTTAFASLAYWNRIKNKKMTQINNYSFRTASFNQPKYKCNRNHVVELTWLLRQQFGILSNLTIHTRWKMQIKRCCFVAIQHPAGDQSYVWRMQRMMHVSFGWVIDSMDNWL